MIITRAYASKLVRDGKAIKDGAAQDDNEPRWQIVVRTDNQRIDHYKLNPGQLATIQVQQ